MNITIIYLNMAQISWQPFNYQPIKLRVERLYGNYFKDVPVNTKDHYNNTRVELVFYKDF